MHSHNETEQNAFHLSPVALWMVPWSSGLHSSMPFIEYCGSESMPGIRWMGFESHIHHIVPVVLPYCRLNSLCHSQGSWLCTTEPSPSSALKDIRKLQNLWESEELQKEPGIISKSHHWSSREPTAQISGQRNQACPKDTQPKTQSIECSPAYL